MIPSRNNTPISVMTGSGESSPVNAMESMMNASSPLVAIMVAMMPPKPMMPLMYNVSMANVPMHPGILPKMDAIV